MENLIKRIEKDFNAFLDRLEYVLGNNWSGGKRNSFVGMWELYLQQIDYSNNEELLCIFNTADKELIHKTFNDNIRIFEEIVKAWDAKMDEQYDKNNSDMTIREFWEQKAEIDYYDVDYKKVLNNPLHYYFLEFDDIPKDKVEELIFHIDNNCELEFVMTDDDGDLLLDNSNSFSQWYDDDYTMGELFEHMYKYCSLHVKKCKKYLIENIKNGIEKYGEYEIHQDEYDEEYLKKLLNDYSLKYYYSNDFRTIYITEIKAI